MSNVLEQKDSFHPSNMAQRTSIRMYIFPDGCEFTQEKDGWSDTTSS